MLNKDQYAAILFAVLLIVAVPATVVRGSSATDDEPRRTGMSPGTVAQSGNNTSTPTPTPTSTPTSTPNETAGPPPVIQGTPPTDLNGDGLYRDVNGDERLSVADTQALLTNLRDPSVQNNIEAYDYSNDGRVDVGDVQKLFRIVLGTSTGDRDGDGLPDTFEESVVGTDPFDADSDSAGTDTNEADNGTIDGLEDFDSDGLTTYEEFRVGTDPLSNDTDGDGLTDRFEVRFGPLDPLAADTDEDGTDDGAEDFDSDGLSTLTEQRVGSNPFRADSDADSIDDDIERSETGTNPVLTDTDADGLSDGAEQSVGTDPLDPDTDRDGVLDGNETFTTTTKNNSVGVSVSVTGSGVVADTITIERQTDPQVNSGLIENQSVAPVVSIESGQEFDNATVSFDYNRSKMSGIDDSELALFRYNKTLQNFFPVNSTVDSSNGTVSATVSEFSTFTVFSVPNWGAQFNAEVPGPDNGGSEARSVDVAFVIDSSGSLRNTDPRGSRKVAAKRFVGALLDRDRAAVIDFDSDARVLQEFTSDFDSVNNSTEELDANGGTSIASGIRAANGEFDTASDNSQAKIMILLTDGRAPRAPARTAAAEAADRNITIFSIGFGDSDSVLLRDIAQETGGEFYEVDSAADLPEVFSRVAEGATGPTDTDGDGLPDSVEEGDVRVGVYVSPFQLAPDAPPDELGSVRTRSFTGLNTGTFNTSPDRADTDGDGLSDGEELGERVTIEAPVEVSTPSGLTVQYTYDVSYYRIISNPTETDSDGDGIQDFEERDTWNSDPLDRNSDDDRFPDFQDPRINTEDDPPNVLLRSDNWAKRVCVYLLSTPSSPAPAAPGGTDIVRAKPFYNPIIGEPGFRPSEASISNNRLDPEFKSELLLSGINPIRVRENSFCGFANYVVTFDRVGLRTPKRYWINMTDRNGNKISYLVETGEGRLSIGGREAQLASAAVVSVSAETGAGAGAGAGAGVALGSGGAAIAAGGAVGALLFFTAAEFKVFGADGSIEQTVTAGSVLDVEREYRGTAVGDVTLPVGTVSTAESELVGETRRGFGWEYIQQEFPGITQNELGEVLRTTPSSGIVTTDEGHLIIGDNPDNDRRIIIELVEDTIVRAYSGGEIRDPLGRRIIIDRSDEHIINRPDHPNYDKIERVIRNPIEIYESGRNVVYIGVVDGEYIIVKTYRRGGGPQPIAWTVSTAYFVGQREGKVDQVNTLLDARKAVMRIFSDDDDPVLIYRNPDARREKILQQDHRYQMTNSI